MRVMYYEMKVDNCTVTINDKPMKGNKIQTQDRVKLLLTGVYGFRRQKGTDNVFPAAEVTITDEKGNVLYETENILANVVGEDGVSEQDASVLSSYITANSDWPAGKYYWQVKFWDLNGTGVILTEMMLEKK